MANLGHSFLCINKMVIQIADIAYFGQKPLDLAYYRSLKSDGNGFYQHFFDVYARDLYNCRPALADGNWRFKGRALAQQAYDSSLKFMFYETSQLVHLKPKRILPVLIPGSGPR